MAATQQVPQHDALVPLFVKYLESGIAPSGLFADDVFAVIHIGGGHYEVRTPAGLERELQQYGGPIQTQVLRQESTPSGFILEFTQRSPRGDLYEELAWALVYEGKVREIRWYCTGVVPGA
jgi:hypothetical protein